MFQTRGRGRDLEHEVILEVVDEVHHVVPQRVALQQQALHRGRPAPAPAPRRPHAPQRHVLAPDLRHGALQALHLPEEAEQLGVDAHDVLREHHVQGRRGVVLEAEDVPADLVGEDAVIHDLRRASVSGIRTHRRRPHQLPEPGFWSLEKWRKPEKWGEMGGEWGSGHSTRDVGCGGLWWDVLEENGTQLGEKWEEIGTKHRFFTIPFPPFSPEVKDLPHSSLCKKPAHRTHRRRNGNFCHSPALTATAASADASRVHRTPPGRPAWALFVGPTNSHIPWRRVLPSHPRTGRRWVSLIHTSDVGGCHPLSSPTPQSDVGARRTTCGSCVAQYARPTSDARVRRTRPQRVSGAAATH